MCSFFSPQNFSCPILKAQENFSFFFSQIFTVYAIIFLTLSLTHESGIQDMIARDTEDVLEREALEEITSKHINSHRMELAHHDATGWYKIFTLGLYHKAYVRNLRFVLIFRENISDILRTCGDGGKLYLYDSHAVRSAYGKFIAFPIYFTVEL